MKNIQKEKVRQINKFLWTLNSLCKIDKKKHQFVFSLIVKPVTKCFNKLLKMLPKEVLHIGDGILQSKSEFLKKILVDAEIEQHYVVEEKPFAR